MNIDRSGCTGTRHGTADAYRHHRCRCPDATAANSRYGKLRRAGLIEPTFVDNIGVVRRRQALAAIGWGLADLAPYFGTQWRGIGDHASNRRVRRDTLERWRRVYDLLSMTPGPNDLVRKRAKNRGWVPPLAWDEDRIDDPDARPNLGGRSARRTADVSAEARFLLGFGLSEFEVAKRLDVSVDWVKRLLGGGKKAVA